jgi:hypothetical protein
LCFNASSKEACDCPAAPTRHLHAHLAKPACKEDCAEHCGTKDAAATDKGCCTDEKAVLLTKICDDNGGGADADAISHLAESEAGPSSSSSSSSSSAPKNPCSPSRWAPIGTGAASSPTLTAQDNPHDDAGASLLTGAMPPQVHRQSAQIIGHQAHYHRIVQDTDDANVLRIDRATNCGDTTCDGDPACAGAKTHESGDCCATTDGCEHACVDAAGIANPGTVIRRDPKSHNSWLWNLLSVDQSAGTALAEGMLGKYLGVDRAAINTALAVERGGAQPRSPQRRASPKARAEGRAGSKTASLQVPLVGAKFTPGGGGGDDQAAIDPSTLLSKTVFQVDGMCCAAEAVIINKLFDRHSGVDKVSVDVLGRTCTVQHFPQKIPPSALLDLLNNKGLRASIISCTLAGGADSGEAMRAAVAMAAKHAKANRFPKWYVMIGTLCWFVSLLHFAEPPPLEVALSNDTDSGSGSGAHAGHDHGGHGGHGTPVAGGQVSAWHYFKYVGLVSVVLCMPGILKKAWGSLKMCMMDINILMTIAVIGACAMQDYSEGAAVVCLFALSDWLSTRATVSVVGVVGCLSVCVCVAQPCPCAPRSSSSSSSSSTSCYN